MSDWIRSILADSLDSTFVIVAPIITEEF